MKRLISSFTLIGLLAATALLSPRAARAEEEAPDESSSPADVDLNPSDIASITAAVDTDDDSAEARKKESRKEKRNRKKAEDIENGREPLTRVHAVGLGYNFKWLTSPNTGGMRFHGPAVAYAYDVGRRVRFMLNARSYFPVVARMNNDKGSYSGSIRKDYEEAWAFDFTLGVGGMKRLGDKATLILGGGPHFSILRINSDVYVPVEAVTMGIAALGRLRFDLDDRDRFKAGVDAQLAADFLSLITQNSPADLAFVGSVVGTVGVKF